MSLMALAFLGCWWFYAGELQFPRHPLRWLQFERIPMLSKVSWQGQGCARIQVSSSLLRSESSLFYSTWKQSTFLAASVDPHIALDIVTLKPVELRTNRRGYSATVLLPRCATQPDTCTTFRTCCGAVQLGTDNSGTSAMDGHGTINRSMRCVSYVGSTIVIRLQVPILVPPVPRHKNLIDRLRRRIDQIL